MNLLHLILILFTVKGIVVSIEEGKNVEVALKRLRERVEIDTFYFPFKGEVARELGLTGVVVLYTGSEKEADELLNLAKSLEYVEFAEPVIPLKLFINDPLLHWEWGLFNQGQPYYGIMRRPDCNDDTLILKRGTEGASIGFIEAYGIMKRRGIKDTVVVAILDTGIDFTHPELTGQIWVNQGEIEGNFLDDDGNGFVDDIRGWDFSGDYPSLVPQEDNDPTDYHGHGTHVAGIVGSLIDNLEGIAGIAPAVKLMALKIFPNATNVTAAKAILYATEMGADVINMSWGLYMHSELIKRTIDCALQRGTIPVAAVGNTGDSSLAYPARFEGVIAVGASDSRDRRAYFSSYGEALDILAPGEDILSLRARDTDMYGNGPCPEPEVHIIDSIYYLADGTSMAAPFVSGAAACIRALTPGLKPEEVKSFIFEGAHDLIDPNGNGYYLPGWDIYSGFGRLYLPSTLQPLPSLVAKIKRPHEFERCGDTVYIIGTASGDDFIKYRVEYGEGFLPENFVSITHSYTPVEDGTLAVFIPPHPGWFTVKLNVNERCEDMSYFFVKGVDIACINSPHDGDTVLGSARVRLTVRGNFSYYRLRYRREDEANYHDLIESSVPVEDSLIFLWYTGDLPQGNYTLKLDVKSNTIGGDSVRVYVKEINLTGWPSSFSGFGGGSPKIADLDGDGESEVVLGTTDGIYVYENDGSARDGWPVVTGEYARSSPAIWDLDNDGKKEIIIATSTEQYTHLYVINDDGTIEEGWPKVLPPSLYLLGTGHPLVADIDNNGDFEILYPVHNGIIYAFRANGESYLEGQNGYFRAATGSVSFSSTPSIFVTDFDGDGGNEVIVVWGKANWPGSGVWIWKEDGEPYSSNPYGLFYLIEEPEGAVMADLDGDGLMELIVSGGDPITVHAIKGDSTEPDGWPVSTGLPASSYIVNPPAVGDIDGDGQPEIVISIFGMNSSFIFALRADGSVLWSREIPFDLGPPVLLMDGDEEKVLLRYVIPFMEEGITLIDEEGEVSPFPFRVYSQNPLWNEVAPAIGDLNQDGDLDIVFPAVSTNVYAWTLDTPPLSSWPMFRGDLRNSGIYCGPYQNVEEVENRRFKLTLFPNPSRGAIKIIVGKNIPGIAIYDLSGRRVKRWRYEEGILNLNMRAGVYFVKVGKKTFKVVLLK